MFLKSGSGFSKAIFAILFSTLITACGGGGGSGDSDGGTTNNTPSISGTPITSVNENEAYSFTPTTNNFSGGTLNFSISNLPIWASFNTATGQLSGTPDFESAATYSGITISASNGSQSANLTAFSIEVINVNRLPNISSDVNISITETYASSVPLVVSDEDGDSVNVEIGELPDWIFYDNGLGSFNINPQIGDSGVVTVPVVISDGTDSQSVDITFTVYEATEVTGKVIDGYVDGAIIYVDSNLDHQFNEGEYFAYSSEGGNYQLFLPLELLENVTRFPLRAYLGDGASDETRTNVNFAETPITISFPPLLIDQSQLPDLAPVYITPFSNELAKAVEESVNALNTGSMTKDELLASISENRIIVALEILSNIIDPSESGLSNEEIEEVIFGDFIETASDEVNLTELGEQLIDEVIVEQDVRDSDGDGEPNNVDTDDDNDGVEDAADAFPLDPLEFLDTDLDGVGNNADSDDDNDGVEDNNDAFPLDSSETVDSDLDGVGDNADFYPQDISCSLENQGDGEVCYLTSLVEQNVEVVASSSSSLYLYAESQLFIFDLETENFEVLALENLTAAVFSTTYNKLYIGFDGGAVATLEDDLSTTGVAQLDSCISTLIDTGNVITARECNGYYGVYKTINGQGEIISASQGYTSIQNAWNPVESRLYHFRDGFSPNDIHYTEIDNDGLITGSGESPYHSDYSIIGPITVSSNGDLVLLGSGDLYRADDLQWYGSIGTTFDIAFWQENNQLVTLHSQYSNILKRRDEDYKIVESILLPGEPKAVVQKDEGAFVLVKAVERYILMSYLPSDDSDSDGVENTEDAFPLDVAASVDSDFDGYPDSWNEGQSMEDSTTGLTIDAFPLDSACWLDSHSIDGLCDYSATMPSFIPDNVVADDEGNIYLLSKENNRVYRWLKDSETFGNPIVVGTESEISSESPRIMTYSSNHGRLYYGYDSGEITYTDLSTLDREQSFSALSQTVYGLAAVGNYLLAQDNSGAWESHHIIDIDGEITDSVEWNHYSQSYAWDPLNSRVYFQEHSDLGYEEINQDFGEITDSGSVYNTNYYVQHPIKLSSDYSKIILANGVIVSTSDFSAVSTLGESHADVQWLENTIVVLRNVSGSSEVELYASDTYEVLDTFSLEGTAVNVFNAEGDVVAVTQNDDQSFNFTVIDTADSDDDGIPGWWEQAYGFSDEDSTDAALDLDEDTLSNLDEYVYRSNPTVNDLALDTDEDGLSDAQEFGLGTNINLTDSDSDGLSDSDEVNIYGTSPTERDTDGDQMPDGWEVTYGFDANVVSSGELDSDDDGVTDVNEYYLGSDPTDIDDLPEVADWTGYQGNAAHNGFIPLVIDSDNLSVRWSTSLPNNVSDFHPVVAKGDYVYATNESYFGDQYLFAMDTLDGTVHWSNDFGDIHSVNAPAIDADKIYVQTGGHSDSFLYAFDLADGAEVFASSYGNQWSRYKAPTIFEGDVYVAGGSYGGSYKFDGTSGVQGWFRDLVQCDEWTPAVDDEFVYYFDIGLKKANKETGSAIESLGEVQFNWSCLTPVLGGQNDAFIAYGDTLVAYDLLSNQVKWTSERDSNYSNSPVVGLGKLYVIHQGSLEAIDQFTGEILWSWSPANSYSLNTNILLTQNLLFVGDSINTYAINVDSQEQVWSYPISGDISISLEGALYISGDNGQLVAVNWGGDEDEDGLDDWWEDRFGLDKLNSTDATTDLDEDGLTNLEEFELFTDPTLEDTDADGLTDFDEHTVHLSDPRDSDSDDDNMPDGWEIEQGFDLLNSADAFADQDNDGAFNVEEYLQGTDPLDEVSVPAYVTTNQYSFEDGLVPDEWIADNTMGSSWGVDLETATDGNYSMFSSGSSAIEYTDLFIGNSLQFDIDSNCESSFSFTIYLDGETIFYDYYSDGWVQAEVLIPRGSHTLRIESFESCGVRIDNVNFSALESIQTQGIQFAVVTDQKLKFYDFEQALLREVDIPNLDGSARDLTVLNDGKVAIFNGVFDPYLSIYTPESHTWQHHLIPDLSIVNNGTYGGISSFDNFIFLGDMNTSGDDTAGVIRFDVTDNSVTHFSAEEYIDLSIGLDSLLYTLSGTKVDVYSPDSMDLLNSFVVADARSVTADSDGNFYTATWDGKVYKYDENGVSQTILTYEDYVLAESISYGNYDININERNELFITNTYEQVLQTTTELNSLALLYSGNTADFLATVESLDTDEDGMPDWWETKFGLDINSNLDDISDLDDDGLDNISEYQLNTDPSESDTDTDGLTDFDELNTHNTDPLIADTDGDSLLDGAEINDHLTNPLLKDSDADGFDDDKEIGLYETDPNDENSLPEAITDLSIDFEDGQIPVYLSQGESSNADWFVEDSTESSNGDYVLRSGDIDDSQQSIIEIEGVFASGTFSLDAYVSSESCCDSLEVYLNEERVLTTVSSEWTTYEFDIVESGEYTIKFRYEKDGSVSSGDDSAFIDNLSFSVN